MLNSPITTEPGGNLLRPHDPTRLPPEKVGRWMFTAIAWKDMNPEQRVRWREWFEWAIAPGGELWDERHKRAVLRGARLDQAELAGVDLTNADLTGASLRGTDLSGAELHGTKLSRARLEEAGLQRANIVDANLADAHISGADLTGADFSGSLLHDMDLTQVDFKDARLFGTKITDPIWWVELPRATISGRTVFPTALPEHPIQDVLGLPPLLRRRIADAQYIRDMHRKAGTFGRAMMWLWGMTCSYGQSIGRWTFCTVLLLVWFSVVYTLFDFNFNVQSVAHFKDQPWLGTAESQVHHPSFWEGLYFSISTMMTLGLGDVVPASGWARLFVGIQEVFGYLMLGGLLSIFSNKLARLS